MKVYAVGLYIVSVSGAFLSHEATKIFSTKEKALAYKGDNPFLFIYEFEVE